ncbi:unnamed protein product [Onchocerca flexuosa]|uniref:Miff domain-containing protein n=1 Tax=Onchocerca flexuosa TaxID=387005 RepID=A0A183I8C1_9BILA|nr:unnamed protein product [Onchocerca flexuosa]
MFKFAELERTVEDFTPVTTSTPLLRLRHLNDSNDNSNNGDEDTYNVQKIVQNEKLDVLEVESMDMSNSNNPSPVTTDVTRKLFRQSAVFRPLVKFFWLYF